LKSKARRRDQLTFVKKLKQEGEKSSLRTKHGNNSSKT